MKIDTKNDKLDRLCMALFFSIMGAELYSYLADNPFYIGYMSLWTFILFWEGFKKGW